MVTREDLARVAGCRLLGAANGGAALGPRVAIAHTL